jgi:uroporphyrinogen-III synthase
MIPKIVPPLLGAAVLVTRPAEQAGPLCTQIEALAGEALRFPAIAIEPLDAPPAEPCDLAVFVSVNAVAYGRHLLPPPGTVRVAAIGKATAAALRAAGIAVDYVPDAGFTSEDLLAHPDLRLSAGMRALIVRGNGGRELLRETFAAHGLEVQVREVYRRVQPAVDPTNLASLEARWAEGEVDVVTLTSVVTFENLRAMLSERGRELLQSTPVLVVSERIAAAVRATGHRGEIIVAPGADEASMIGALTRWYARARDPLKPDPRRSPEKST